MIVPVPRFVVRLVLKGLWQLIVQPIVLGLTLGRLFGAAPHIKADILECNTCRALNPLLGSWECHCGYSWFGHYWMPCPNPRCRSVAPFYSCETCGASTPHPTLCR